MTRDEAIKVADATADAYSFDRYSNWRACAVLLARLNYNARGAEAILRSKHMRWAADGSEKPYGRVTSRDLERYLAGPSGHLCRGRELQDLINGTFSHAA